MKITLKNDFHNSQVTIQVAGLPHIVTPSQERRIHKALCGNKGCQCGSIRGPQYSPDGERLTVTRDWYGNSGNVGYPALKISLRA